MSKIIELLAHYPPYQLVHAAEMVRDTFGTVLSAAVPTHRAPVAPDDGARPHYPISQKELVEASGMDKVRISREIHRLVEKGILFTENSVQDKRISLVSFTPAGLTLFQQLKTEAGSWQHTSPTIYRPRRVRAFACTCRASAMPSNNFTCWTTSNPHEAKQLCHHGCQHAAEPGQHAAA